MTVTAYPTLRLKLTQPQSLQMRFLPAVPGFNAAAAAAAIDVKVDGPSPAFSTDNAIVRWDGGSGRRIQNSTALLDDDGNLRLFGLLNLEFALWEDVSTLIDAPLVTLFAAAGSVFLLTAAGDRTIDVPSDAPEPGRTQKLIIRHTASGANRTSLADDRLGRFIPFRLHHHRPHCHSQRCD